MKKLILVHTDSEIRVRAFFEKWYPNQDYEIQANNYLPKKDHIYIMDHPDETLSIVMEKKSINFDYNEIRVG